MVASWCGLVVLIVRWVSFNLLLVWCMFALCVIYCLAFGWIDFVFSCFVLRFVFCVYDGVVLVCLVTCVRGLDWCLVVCGFFGFADCDFAV